MGSDTFCNYRTYKNEKQMVDLLLNHGLNHMLWK